MKNEWLNKAKEMYENGKKFYQIANELGVNRKTVSIKLKELGYKADERYVRKINPEKLRKYDYSYAENIFEVIDTEEKAYWLGFLYADGYVSYRNNTVSLALAEEDIEHLNKFRHFFRLDNKPFTRKTKKVNNKKYIGYEFSICNEKIKSDLCKLGCCPQKTFNITFPSDNIVPSNLKKDFIRGYIDGDGCITTSQSSYITLDIVGTDSFLDGYQKWTRLKYNKLHHFKDTDVKHSMYSGFAAIYILDILYENATIFLERKHNKYLELRRLRMSSVKRPKSIIAELSVKSNSKLNATLKALLIEAAKSYNTKVEIDDNRAI